MKKIWNFILKYRIILVLIIIVVFCSLIAVAAKQFLYPDDKRAVYGGRLDGIENVEITDERINQFVNKIKADDTIDEASVSIKGRIINITLKSNNEKNTMDKIKEKADNILKEFSDEEIAFYDFQFFIKNEEANYIMIGYKNKIRENISWESDEIVSEEENEKE